MVTFLLDSGVPIDPRDSSNCTPLLDAASAGQTECMTVLLKRGANVRMCDIFMKNCLHLAVENENLETLNVLLDDKDALWNLTRPDVHERVPLHYAAMGADVKVLSSSTAKPS